MAYVHKYGLGRLREEFPNDEFCLNYIFETLHYRRCRCGGRYKNIINRTQFQCSRCRKQISPLAGTLLQKTTTSLTLWFFAFFIFSNAKSGISAKELERQLGVTYKCAWRMLSLIRKAIAPIGMLQGTVEIDTAFLGGRHYGGKDNKARSAAMLKKAVVAIAVERGGRMRAKILRSAGSTDMTDFIDRNIKKENTVLVTDNSSVYLRSDKEYDRYFVNHKTEFVNGPTHINTCESVISHIKRSLSGTQKVVSRRHLQSYLDTFAFHYDNRHDDRLRFEELVTRLFRMT